MEICKQCGTLYNTGYPLCPKCTEEYNSAYGYTSMSKLKVKKKSMNNSYFDGGPFQLLGWTLLGGLLSLFTLGIGAPLALCMIYRWEAKHTVIDGRRLQFTGTGLGLLGRYLLWLLLTIVTMGIYGFWFGIALKKWRIANTTHV